MRTPQDVAGTLLTRIDDGSARVGIVGLGYVGLPLAVEQAKAGFEVVGIDLSPQKAEKINAGESYVQDVSNEDLKAVVASGKLRATTEFSAISDLDIVIVAVPTPLTKNLTPELSHIESAAREIAKYLKRGQLIGLESTTYPGTTEEVMQPVLESSGLKVEVDFFLAHSPERVDPGNHSFKTKNTPKIVGGVGPISHKVALAFYSRTIPTVSVGSAKAAEMVKIFENTFRAVNIALVNELTLLCDGMDLNVWEILEAAFTKPFGIMPFYPGPGVGGHCIPLDPHYLEWKAKEYAFETHFISLAGEINRKMPSFVREKALRCLNSVGMAASRSKLLFLGVAYKKDVPDYRESPALKVMELLQRDGAKLSFYDPFVPKIEEHGLNLIGEPELTENVLQSSDLVIITTNHSQFDYASIVKYAKLVLDTRNATKAVTEDRDKIVLL